MKSRTHCDRCGINSRTVGGHRTEAECIRVLRRTLAWMRQAKDAFRRAYEDERRVNEARSK